MAAPEPHMVLYLIGEKFIGGASAEKLESKVWSKLPEDLLQYVLLWLPSVAQARFRGVCKSWHSLLTSASFLERSAWLTLVCLAPVCALDMRESDHGFQHFYKSYRVDLNFLPSKVRSLWEYGMFTQCGLLGMTRTDQRGELILCLVNLVNKTWRELPPLECSPGSPLGEEGEIVVVADKRATSSFQVLLLWTTDEHLTYLSAYSSMSGDWTTVASTLQATPGEARCSVPCCVVCKGVLYVLVWHPKAQLLLLDAGNAELLRRVELPWSLPKPLVPERQFLSEHGGRVFWTAQSSADTISIWIMEEGAAIWSQVSVLPVGLFSDASEQVNLLLLNVQIADDTVFLTVIAMGKQAPCLLAYHILKDSWHTIMRGEAWEGGYFEILESRPALHLGAP